LTKTLEENDFKKGELIMIKILGKLFLMQMPFLLIGGLIGGYLLYMGFTTKDDALTAIV